MDTKRIFRPVPRRIKRDAGFVALVSYVFSGVDWLTRLSNTIPMLNHIPWWALFALGVVATAFWLFWPAEDDVEATPTTHADHGSVAVGDASGNKVEGDFFIGPRTEVNISTGSASQERGPFYRFTFQEQVYEAIKDLVDTMNGKWYMQDHDGELNSRRKHLREVQAWAAHYHVNPPVWASEDEAIKDQLAEIALKLHGREPGYDGY